MMPVSTALTIWSSALGDARAVVCWASAGIQGEGSWDLCQKELLYNQEMQDLVVCDRWHLVILQFKNESERCIVYKSPK